MKAVAFVPVKLNSERMPQKNIQKFDDGRELIRVFLERLLKVPGFDQVYVFCSDASIKDHIPLGVTFLKRSAFLDRSDATPQDIMKAFINKVDSDIYAVCHCTSPFVSIEHMRECLDAVKSGRYDSSFTGNSLQKLLWTKGGKAVNFDPADIPRTQDLEPVYEEVSAAYVFTKKLFHETGRRIGFHPHITQVKGIECIDIDYPQDFAVANLVYMHIVRGGGYSSRVINNNLYPIRNGVMVCA